ICSAAVFFFDSMVTTAEEIRCFWGRKITGAAILFWPNKYMTALYLVWDLAIGLDMSEKVCTTPLLLGSTELIYSRNPHNPYPSG
ncbi:hypothetical protein BD311DRAFT_677911, partial [Dichomitus squalens]